MLKKIVMVITMTMVMMLMLIWGDDNSDNDGMTVYFLLFLLSYFSCRQSSTLAGTSGILKNKYREWMNFLRNL